MRMKFKVVRGAEAEDLPVTYDWEGEFPPPEEFTAEEAKMMLLFEIAGSLKSLEFPNG